MIPPLLRTKIETETWFQSQFYLMYVLRKVSLPMLSLSSNKTKLVYSHQPEVEVAYEDISGAETRSEIHLVMAKLQLKLKRSRKKNI